MNEDEFHSFSDDLDLDIPIRVGDIKRDEEQELEEEPKPNPITPQPYQASSSSHNYDLEPVVSSMLARRVLSRIGTFKSPKVGTICVDPDNIPRKPVRSPSGHNVCVTVPDYIPSNSLPHENPMALADLDGPREISMPTPEEFLAMMTPPSKTSPIRSKPTRSKKPIKSPSGSGSNVFARMEKDLNERRMKQTSFLKTRESIELASCTFSPSVSRHAHSIRSDSFRALPLTDKSRIEKELEKKRLDIERKKRIRDEMIESSCTYVPPINSKSKKYVKELRDGSRELARREAEEKRKEEQREKDRLEEERKKKEAEIERRRVVAKQMMEEKEKKRIERFKKEHGCTFAPQVSHSVGEAGQLERSAHSGFYGEVLFEKCHEKQKDAKAKREQEEERRKKLEEEQKKANDRIYQEKEPTQFATPKAEDIRWIREQRRKWINEKRDELKKKRRNALNASRKNMAGQLERSAHSGFYGEVLFEKCHEKQKDAKAKREQEEERRKKLEEEQKKANDRIYQEKEPTQFATPKAEDIRWIREQRRKWINEKRDELKKKMKMIERRRVVAKQMMEEKEKKRIERFKKEHGCTFAPQVSHSVGEAGQLERSAHSGRKEEQREKDRLEEERKKKEAEIERRRVVAKQMMEEKEKKRIERFKKEHGCTFAPQVSHSVGEAGQLERSAHSGFYGEVLFEKCHEKQKDAKAKREQEEERRKKLEEEQKKANDRIYQEKEPTQFATPKAEDIRWIREQRRKWINEKRDELKKKMKMVSMSVAHTMFNEIMEEVVRMIGKWVREEEQWVSGVTNGSFVDSGYSGLKREDFPRLDQYLKCREIAEKKELEKLSKKRDEEGTSGELGKKELKKVESKLKSQSLLSESIHFKGNVVNRAIELESVYKKRMQKLIVPIHESEAEKYIREKKEKRELHRLRAQFVPKIVTSPKWRDGVIPNGGEGEDAEFDGSLTESVLRDDQGDKKKQQYVAPPILLTPDQKDLFTRLHGTAIIHMQNRENRRKKYEQEEIDSMKQAREHLTENARASVDEMLKGRRVQPPKCDKDIQSDVFLKSKLETNPELKRKVEREVQDKRMENVFKRASANVSGSLSGVVGAESGILPSHEEEEEAEMGNVADDVLGMDDLHIGGIVEDEKEGREEKEMLFDFHDDVEEQQEEEGDKEMTKPVSVEDRYDTEDKSDSEIETPSRFQLRTIYSNNEHIDHLNHVLDSLEHKLQVSALQHKSQSRTKYSARGVESHVHSHPLSSVRELDDEMDIEHSREYDKERRRKGMGREDDKYITEEGIRRNNGSELGKISSKKISSKKISSKKISSKRRKSREGRSQNLSKRERARQMIEVRERERKKREEIMRERKKRERSAKISLYRALDASISGVSLSGHVNSVDECGSHDVHGVDECGSH
ncbi:hypothetical protein ADUPG1_000026, partial [Aduncisulcus paluster]